MVRGPARKATFYICQDPESKHLSYHPLTGGPRGRATGDVRFRLAVIRGCPKFRLHLDRPMHLH